MPQKILLVTGSPRKNGNTHLLADAFENGALASGNQVFRFDAGKAQINGCIGCRYCFSHKGKCTQEDDMQQAYRYLRACDVLVLAAPVYFFDFSAQMKVFIDRLYCDLSAYSSPENPFTITSSALLLVQELTDLAVAESAIKVYQKTAAYASWNDLGIILVPGVAGPGAIANNPLLTTAYELGASIT